MFVEALVRQYMLDVDSRIASLQRLFTNDSSKSVSMDTAQHRVMKWDGSLDEAEVQGVLSDASVSPEDAKQPLSQQSDVDVHQLLLVASTMLPWSRLHTFYELESTLLFVKQIHETDAGIHSTGELPEVA